MHILEYFDEKLHFNMKVLQLETIILHGVPTVLKGCWIGE